MKKYRESIMQIVFFICCLHLHYRSSGDLYLSAGKWFSGNPGNWTA